MSLRRRIALSFGAAAILITAAFGSMVDADAKLMLGFPGDIGPTDVPAVMALQAMEYDVRSTTCIEFGSPDVQSQALLSGDINLASMGPATVMSANIVGADLRMITSNNKNDLLVVAAAEITQCSQLEGKPVAYHSDGSTSTAHLMSWISDKCGASPEWLVISGSSNRTTALINGRIDGTIVRTEDWVHCLRGVDSDAHVLAELSESQSELLPQTIVINIQFLDDNVEYHQQFLEALDEQFALVNADPEAYAEMAYEYLPNMDPDALAEIYTSLSQQGAFPETGLLGPDRGAECVGYQAHDVQGNEDNAATLNALVSSVRFTGGIGTVGVFIPEDPGAPDELAQEGKARFEFGNFWFKGQQMGCGQAPAKRYKWHLRDLIAADKVTPLWIVSHNLPLDDAPDAYAHFDARDDGWTKVVLDPTSSLD